MPLLTIGHGSGGAEKEEGGGMKDEGREDSPTETPSDGRSATMRALRAPGAREDTAAQGTKPEAWHEGGRLKAEG